MVLPSQRGSINASDTEDIPIPQPDNRKFLFLYICHTIVTFGARTWKFLVPILLMSVAKTTLLPGALFIAAQTLCMVLLCSALGRRVDRQRDRRRVALLFAVVADIPVVISLIPILTLLLLGLDFNGGAGGVCLVALMVLGSIEAVASAVLDVQIKKDWVVCSCSFEIEFRVHVLAGIDRSLGR